LRVGVPFEKQNDILQQMEPEGSEIRFVQHLFLARLQGDQNMRRNSLILGTTFLTIGFATAAAALPAGPPSGLKAAIEEQSSVDTVHCRPGRVHWHRWGWGTGCRSYSGYYPRYYSGYQPYYSGYNYPRYYSQPGFSFSFGPRYRYGGRYGGW
jgi:hypothetical protein